MEKQNDLIVAAATPPAMSAIAVVRLSGRGASKAVESAMELPCGRLRGMRRAVGDFGGIDRIVAVSWPRGRSYTGEEMVDIMCHGMPGNASAIVDRLVAMGARAAEPGEFTRRAWMNGRVTAVDVMALSARMTGTNTYSADTGELKQELARLLEEAEAVIEFEEDHGEGSEKSLEALISKAAGLATRAKEELRRMEVLPRLYIMGPVNAGKSTLFNMLCGRETALVTSIPGTTRDGASAKINLAGRQLEIVDTAGTGGDDLDGMALRIAIAGMRRGDRIVWLDPMEEPPPGELAARYSLMCFHSRADEQTAPGEWAGLSSPTGQGMNKVVEFAVDTEEGSPSWSMERIERFLSEALECAKGRDIALAAEFIREAWSETREKHDWGTAVERALERFCVGK